jgi:hypothetical protein
MWCCRLGVPSCFLDARGCARRRHRFDFGVILPARALARGLISRRFDLGVILPASALARGHRRCGHAIRVSLLAR